MSDELEETIDTGADDAGFDDDSTDTGSGDGAGDAGLGDISDDAGLDGESDTAVDLDGLTDDSIDTDDVGVSDEVDALDDVDAVDDVSVSDDVSGDDTIDPDEFGFGSDSGGSPGSDASRPDESDSSSGLRDTLPSVGTPSVGLPSIGFDARRFGVVVGLCAAGLVAGGLVPFVGPITQYVGLFAAAFLIGVTNRSGYLETGSAGAVAAGVSVLLSTLTTGSVVFGFDLLRRYGLAVTGVGVFIGCLVAVTGLYFGRDLRDGLSRSV